LFFILGPGAFGVGLNLMAGSSAWVVGATIGAASGAFNAAINGGNLGDVLRGAVVGGIQGGITAGLLKGMESTGFNMDTALHVAGHGVVGGAANVALGGKFQDGFLSAAASAGAADMGAFDFIDGDGPGPVAGRTAVAGIVGGTASALGGGKFANGAYTAAFQHLLNAEMPKTAIGAGLKWFGAGFKNGWTITEKDPMGQDLLRFPEVEKAIDQLNASTDPHAVIHWYRNIGLLGPTPIRTYISSFFADLTGVSLFSDQNVTRALVGSIHDGRVYRDSSGYVNVTASDTLSWRSALHLPPKNDGSYGASVTGVKNDMAGWNGPGGNVKLEFNVRTYMPK